MHQFFVGSGFDLTWLKMVEAGPLLTFNCVKKIDFATDIRLLTSSLPLAASPTHRVSL